MIGSPTAREETSAEAISARIDRLLVKADQERAEQYRLRGMSRSPRTTRRQMNTGAHAPGERAGQPGSALWRCRNAWSRWTEAAQKFDGLGKELRARRELRNIRLTNDGFQVFFYRNGKYALTKHFAGFSEESLAAAKIFRDQADKSLPSTRRCEIPPEVLKALSLDSAVDGVARCHQRSCYRVSYRKQDGRDTARSFYYRQIREEEAYAAAIAFREELLRTSSVSLRVLQPFR